MRFLSLALQCNHSFPSLFVIVERTKRIKNFATALACASGIASMRAGWKAVCSCD